MEYRRWVSKRYFVLLLALLVWILSCGGTSPASEVPAAAVVSPMPPVTTEPTAESTPTSTQIEIIPAKTVEPKAVSEPTATPKPTTDSEKDSLPPVIKPSPTSKPTPKPTPKPSPKPSPSSKVNLNLLDLNKIRYRLELEDNSKNAKSVKDINIKGYINKYNSKKDRAVGIPK